MKKIILIHSILVTRLANKSRIKIVGNLENHRTITSRKRYRPAYKFETILDKTGKTITRQSKKIPLTRYKVTIGPVTQAAIIPTGARIPILLDTIGAVKTWAPIEAVILELSLLGINGSIL